jgi:hypothetical protein
MGLSERRTVFRQKGYLKMGGELVILFDDPRENERKRPVSISRLRMEFRGEEPPAHGVGLHAIAKDLGMTESDLRRLKREHEYQSV